MSKPTRKHIKEPLPEIPRFCKCAEMLDSEGKRRPAPKWHNCEYVRRRNALIGEAFKLAGRRVRLNGHESPEETTAKWTRAFSMAMDELARPLLSDTKKPGRRVQPPPGLSVDKEPTNPQGANPNKALTQ